VPAVIISKIGIIDCSIVIKDIRRSIKFKRRNILPGILFGRRIPRLVG
jgi:hypothetical protein